MDAADPTKLVKAGFSILPLMLDGSKRPAIKEWKQLQVNRPDPVDIRTWGHRCGIGILCGAISGNLEVIDIDEAEMLGPYLEQLEAFGGSPIWNQLVVVRTPRPGYHLLYRLPEPPEGNQKLAQKIGENNRPKTLIETRGEGGYFVAVGSPNEVHDSRKPYEFLQGTYDEIPVLTMEQREILLNAARSLTEVCFEEFEDPDLMSRQRSRLPITKDSTDGARGRRPGDEFAERHSWREILEPHGWKVVKASGDILFWRQPQKSTPKGHSATTGYKGYDTLYVFSSNCHPFSPGRGYQKFAAYAMLNHGGDFAEAARALREKGYGAPVFKPVTIEESLKVESQANAQAQAPLPYQHTDLEFTDRANGLRFARDWSHCIRSTRSHGYLVYSEKGVWTPDKARAYEAGWHTAQKLYNEIGYLPETERSRYLKAAKRLHSVSGHSQMMAAAATFPGIYAEPTDFDGVQYDSILNVQNCLIDLSTGEPFPHDSSFLITKQANVEFDHKATCPLFDECLKYWFEGDNEMIDFFWRWVGYTLTGFTHFEHFVFLEGPGGNGKTIARETIVDMLGSYVKTLPKASLMVREGGDQSMQMARVVGARMIAVSEVNAGDRLDEGRTKDLVSGELQPARLLYQDGFDFKPCGKLWMHGNHRPRITDTTESIWRRLLVMPFYVIVPESKRDPNLRYKTLSEKSGILNKAIAGWHRCAENRKFFVPGRVDTANQDYRKESSPIQSWLEVAAVPAKEKGFYHPNRHTACFIAYERYRAWALNTGRHVYSDATFRKEMDKVGFKREKFRTTGKTHYTGLWLRDTNNEEE